jgi:DNA polymerase I-like protein with 3'-5' exonuclease and polymerase domains
MANKAFILQRICIFAGKEFDPDSDEQVIEVLRDKFALSLPQRRSMEESLQAVASDHDIIGLILEYRAAGKKKAP